MTIFDSMMLAIDDELSLPYLHFVHMFLERVNFTQFSSNYTEIANILDRVNCRIDAINGGMHDSLEDLEGLMKFMKNEVRSRTITTEV